MNKKKQGISNVIGKGVVSLALNVAKVGVNSAWLSHQPKEPEGLERFKKIK